MRLPRLVACVAFVLPWLLRPGVGAAQSVYSDDPEPPLRHGYLAATRCVDGVPTTVISPHLDPRTRIEIEAHEATHRRQLAGDCDARLHAAQHDAGVRLDREAEAYCAGLAALGLDSLRYGVAVERLREGLYELFEHLPKADVDARLDQYCQPEAPAAPGR
jgi:hypothetical protein